MTFTEPSSIVIVLDNANSTFLAPNHMLVSLRMGELLLFTLIDDGSTVSRIEITKSNSSVLTTCVSINKLISPALVINWSFSP